MEKMITLEKGRKNVRLLYDLINGTNIARVVGRAQTHFIAIGGYNNTYEFLIACGARPEEIAVTNGISFSQQFMANTHLKKILLIKKINYTTSNTYFGGASKKRIDLERADNLEESIMRYEQGGGKIGQGKASTREEWIKPTIVVLDDPSLNLQFEDHRFKYAHQVGFAQVKHRNANPYELVREVMEVEPAEGMMFARYQQVGVDAEYIRNALNDLELYASREQEDGYYFKPTEFKRIVGSNELANELRNMEELNIAQMANNKRLGRENARWIIIPHEAFEWQGYEFLDDSEQFERQLEEEQRQEDLQALEDERRLNDILSQKFTFNVAKGYIGNHLNSEDGYTLQKFIDQVDEVEAMYRSIDLLEGATTDKEYEQIKKNHLVYFLDGRYQDQIRKDDHYLGGKRLVSIDIDDEEYTRQELEAKLESQGLFGLIYSTPRYYYSDKTELRWRIILLADDEMDKSTYSNVVKGVCRMLDIIYDGASAKISQLMGYPMASKDVSLVSGSTVNVDQFRAQNNVVTFQLSQLIQTNKSILDFNHSQAQLTKDVLNGNLPVVGTRNETYRQIMMYLNDTIVGANFSQAHKDEAQAIKDQIINIMLSEGLEEKEVNAICRMD